MTKPEAGFPNWLWQLGRVGGGIDENYSSMALGYGCGNANAREWVLCRFVCRAACAAKPYGNIYVRHDACYIYPSDSVCCTNLR